MTTQITIYFDEANRFEIEGMLKQGGMIFSTSKTELGVAATITPTEFTVIDTEYAVYLNITMENQSHFTVSDILPPKINAISILLQKDGDGPKRMV